MYVVYCDDNIIFHTDMEDRKIFNPKLEVATNKTGSFTFTIYPSNPEYNNLNKLKSIIKVYNDGFLMFRGRILDDDTYFHNEKNIICEGELAFLLDTIQYNLNEITTSNDLLAYLLENHNLQVSEEKQFKLGNVWSVTELQIDDKTNYTTSWDVINKELINKYGGYIWVRHEGNNNYLDYLEDFDVLSNHPTIEFGKNLLDFTKKVKGSEIATSIIPLGKNGITIEDVNSSIKYLKNNEAVNKYGFICKVVEFSDITDKDILKAKGQEYLDNITNLVVSLEVSAIDLSYTSTEFTSFRLGSYIKVLSKPHNIDEYFLINKLTIDLLNPKSNKLVLGKTYSTFSEKAITKEGTKKEITNAILGIQNESVTEDKLNESIRETEEVISSNISQSADEIYLKVSQDFYLKEDADALVESVNTELIQTNEAFEMRFNQFNADIEDVANNTDAKFQEINKFIKFVDGTIILGQEGNKLTLKIENNQISFLQGGTIVAYFSDNKLYVHNGEFLDSLRLGKFAFLPRTNGNLSFKMVGK